MGITIGEKPKKSVSVTKGKVDEVEVEVGAMEA